MLLKMTSARTQTQTQNVSNEDLHQQCNHLSNDDIKCHTLTIYEQKSSYGKFS